MYMNMYTVYIYLWTWTLEIHSNFIENYSQNLKKAYLEEWFTAANKALPLIKLFHSPPPKFIFCALLYSAGTKTTNYISP